MERKMVMDNKFGLMDPNTRENGKMIKQMALESLFMLMETYMKDNGKTIRPMVTVAILMLTVPLTMENGKMISSMEKVLRHGRMVQSMRVNILKEKSMEEEH